MQLDVAGEYLVTASMLVNIKSKMLLPNEQVVILLHLASLHFSLWCSHLAIKAEASILPMSIMSLIRMRDCLSHEFVVI